MSFSELFFAFARKSRNAKTGPIPVSTSDSKTCPPACPLQVACYAKHGPLGMYWAKINRGDYAMSFESLLDNIRALPDDQLWRHNQAGDLPGIGNSIDREHLAALVSANAGKRGFTYTHKPVETDAGNADAVSHANANGFTINLSADDMNEADRLKALNIGPVVVVLPRNASPVSYTPNGHKVVVCPAQQRDDVSCATCGLCAIAKRDAIVGFLAHGVSAKKAETIALN